MTTNDPGHINNLDTSQVQALKGLWLLLDKFLHDPANGGYQAEIFRASAYDNPDMILLRWLRARKWDIYAAYQQLIDTFRWRQEWHVADLVSNGESDLSAEELQSGKSFFTGPDREGRPINYVSAKDHIKGQFSAESTEKITVFAMETGRKLLRGPHEAVTVIFDMTNFGLKNMDYPHMRFLINLLQNHYPESFTLGLVVNAPWVFNGCWYMIKPWLDPVVENKIRFVNNLDELSQFIDPAVLPKHLNGTHAAFQYIPPTDDDLAMQAAFRNDHEGKRAAEDEHRKAAEDYLDVTLRWARGDDAEQVREERTQATKRLRDAFEQLVPYIHTRTHYHRIGVIDEPIFDVAYRRLREKNGE